MSRRNRDRSRERQRGINRTILNGQIRRLHYKWRQWDMCVRTGGPVETEFELFNELKSTLISQVADFKDRDAWLAKIDSACGPAPERKPRAPRAVVARTDVISHEARIPLWSGPNGDEALKRVVGVAWCGKVGRWAIRIRTRLGEYINTHTDGISLFDLAYLTDHFKCIMMVGAYDPLSLEIDKSVGGGFLSPRPGMRKSAWNDYENAQEKLECGGLSIEHDHEMFGHLHTNLADWFSRVIRNEGYKSRGFITTVHAMPRHSSIVKQVDKMMGPSLKPS